MPRTIEGVTYESVAWDVREFLDTAPMGQPGERQEVQQSVRIDWETSAAKQQLFGRLTVQFFDAASKKELIRIVLIGQFVVDRVLRDALHGDMVALPKPVWAAMAREIYDTARGIVLAKSKKLKFSGIPTVPDEAFLSDIAPDDYGLSRN